MLEIPASVNIFLVSAYPSANTAAKGRESSRVSRVARRICFMICFLVVGRETTVFFLYLGLIQGGMCLVLFMCEAVVIACEKRVARDAPNALPSGSTLSWGRGCVHGIADPQGHRGDPRSRTQVRPRLRSRRDGHRTALCSR